MSAGRGAARERGERKLKPASRVGPRPRNASGSRGSNGPENTLIEAMSEPSDRAPLHARASHPGGTDVGWGTASGQFGARQRVYPLSYAGHEPVRGAVRARAAAHPGRRELAGARVQGGGRHAALHPQGRGLARCGTRTARRYIDYVGSWGPMILGHAYPPVRRGRAPGGGARHLLRRALRGARSSWPTAWSRLVPVHREGALRLLRHRGHHERAAPGPRLHRARRKILKFDGCYHGHADAPAGGGRARAWPRWASPARPASPRGAGRPTPWSRPSTTSRRWRRVIAEHGADLAAVIVEPVAGNMGVRGPARGLPAGACATSRTRAGALLIFDEVITGFRLAPRRRPGALRRDARPHLPGQDHRRRAARRGLRRPRRHHGPGGALGPRLPGGHAVRQPAGHGRRLRHPRPPAPHGHSTSGWRRWPSACRSACARAAQAAGVMLTVNRVGSMFTPFFCRGPGDRLRRARKHLGHGALRALLPRHARARRVPAARRSSRPPSSRVAHDGAATSTPPSRGGRLVGSRSLSRPR